LFEFTPSSRIFADTLRERSLLALLLCLAVGLAYSNSFEGEFLFDDYHTIVQNRYLRSLHDTYMLHFDIGRTHGEPIGGGRTVARWTLALNYAISGLNPVSYHAVNLGIHLACVLALFGLARRTLRLSSLHGHYTAKAATGIAFSAALLWGLHPLNTQAVTYIIQRLESLMGLFFLLACYGLLRGSQSKGPFLWYLAAAVSFWLGMWTKEVMATAIIVLPLYDRLFFADSWRDLLRMRWGFYLTVLLPVLWFVWKTAGVFDAGGTGQMGLQNKEITTLEYFSTQPEVIWWYLRLAFWPDPLCLDPDWPIQTDGRVILFAGLTMGALFLAAWWLTLRGSKAGFLGMAFFLILAPTSSLMVIPDPMFEHRMYLPLICVVLAVVLAVWEVVSRMISSDSARLGTAVVLLLVTAVPLGVRTYLRNFDYHSRPRMWANVLDTAPHNLRAQSNLRVSHLVPKNWPAAVDYYRQQMEREPDNPAHHWNLAHFLIRLDRQREAIEALRRTIALNPGHVRAEGQLAALIALDRPWEAEWRFRRVIEEDHRLVQPRIDFGHMLLAQQRFDEATEQFDRALRLHPKSAQAAAGLGDAHLALGDYGEAAAAYERTLRIDNEQWGTAEKLGWLVAAGVPAPNTTPEDALIWTDEILFHTASTNYRALDLRAAILYRLGRTEEAIDTAETALAIVEADEDHSGMMQRLKSYRDGVALRVDDTPLASRPTMRIGVSADARKERKSHKRILRFSMGDQIFDARYSAISTPR